MTTYKDAGVDIDAADDAKRSMSESIDSGDPRVLNTLGAFASLVDGKFPGYEHPILVLKTEEPGSKQKLAFDHGFVRSICFDTINHLIDDIAVMGATPQYTQDLIICGKMEKSVVTEIVKGFADACKEQDCVLTGGETTEQPGVLEPGVYALAASVVGVVEKSKIIDGSKIQSGDQIIAVASNGLHTNGYTLVRSLMDKDPSLQTSECAGVTFLEAIMRPHTCYYHALKGLFGNDAVHGMAHITGGGVQGNLNRILPADKNAVVDLSKMQMPPVFHTIREAGSVEDAEMMKTFNMGVGIAIVVSPDAVDDVMKHLKDKGHESFSIGAVTDGEKSVQFEGSLSW
ncbi:MAG: phosphoribosylformylglycinamidine cyclo-ligase [bacterium]|nr:phosphoribosylformylglycinamidine cyclo-ligase [bacterium]